MTNSTDKDAALRTVVRLALRGAARFGLACAVVFGVPAALGLSGGRVSGKWWAVAGLRAPGAPVDGGEEPCR